MIIPNGHDKDHTVIHGFTHLFETTLNLEIVFVSHDTLERIAHLISDRIVLGISSWNVRFWVFENFTILNENSSNFFQVTSICSIFSDELSNNGEWLGGINSLSWTIEIFNTSSEWVKIATIFIAYTLVSLVSLSTFSTLASLSSGHGTWMSSISFRDRVGLPDIHFSAAGSILSSSSIWVS